jgi:hypothetical protein
MSEGEGHYDWIDKGSAAFRILNQQVNGLAK